MRIAVVGTGIAGMAAAWLLNKKHDVVVYEKNPSVGGHTRTLVVNYNGWDVPVDTGFIVYNERNYPNLVKLFAHLEVETQKSDMSFAVSANHGAFEYSGRSALALFGQPSNLFKPEFIKMLRDIMTFNKRATEVLKRDELITLGAWLDELGLREWFKKYYILPMGAAIWSCPVETMLSYPAQTFVRFFENHGLLTLNDQPQWYTVAGGSHEYIKKLTAPYKKHIRLNTGVAQVVRGDKQVTIKDDKGGEEIFDHVVMAAHADQTYKMIRDLDETEGDILSKFTYQKNVAYLHRDPSFMPRRKACWASWVYLLENEVQENQSLTLTYWMNLLQGIKEEYPLFVTLNPAREPDKTMLFDKHIFEHPVYDEGAIKAQARLPDIQGRRNTWYCGSYHRYGFHEDALTSAIDVAQRLGVQLPWE